MLDAKKLEVEATAHEAVWIGDPAVDVGALDPAAVEAWLADGEARNLPVRPKEKCSKFRWRPLDARERDEAIALSGYRPRPDGEIDAHGYLALINEMCRFGVVSVEGVPLSRDYYHGVRGLDDRSYRRLCAIRLGPAEEGSPLPDRLALVPWLGGLISEATFREER